MLAESLHQVSVTAAVVLLVASTAVSARPLEEIKRRGTITQCANPNALPYASGKPETPGFQIEIGRAIARKMGVQHRVEWIVPRMRAATVDCDMLLDTIVHPDVQGRGIRLSIPYHASGVALGFAPGETPVPRYSDLRPGMRVAVMTNSIASRLVSLKGAHIVPFAFEDEMVEATGRGEAQACASSPATIAYYNLTHPEKKLVLVHAQDSEPELKWNVAVGLRRADDALVSAVNEALRALIDEGGIAAIYAKYGVDYQKP